MKLLELHLRAYGPFTDRHLDLSGGKEGLHVVCGLNEAGKSSALRALRALLYGIPERTQDDFLHAKPELRVGGLLRAADGDERVFYRRKGRKSTLLDCADKPVDEQALARLLGGVDRSLFERLFGIDHAALVKGGQELLEERGREAEALFGAGLGSTAIHSVLQQLDQEAQSLFAPKASKPLLNLQLSRLAETQRRLRDVSLSARQWQEARRSLDRAGQRLREMDGQLAEISRRRGRLERIRRTQPVLAKHTRIRERLQLLGEVPLLAEDFGQRREGVSSKRRIAVDGRLRANDRLADLREKVAALKVSEELLAEADAIEGLREHLGSYRKASRDRPGLQATRVARQAQASRRLAEVRPDLALGDIDRLRPLLGRRRRVTELGDRRGALESSVTKTGNALAEAREKLATRRAELAAIAETPPLDGLRNAVDGARRAGDLDSTISEALRRVLGHESACAQDFAMLGLLGGSVSELLGAALPGDETIRRFAGQLQELEEQRRRLEEERAQGEAEKRETQRALQALRLAGNVPSEAELERARARRAEGWRLLRRQWLDQEDMSDAAQAYGNGETLPEAFEGAMANADTVADRLRREAQRVHEQASAQAKLASCEQKAAQAETELGRIDERLQRLEQAWQQAWLPCGISPLPPREMEVWLGKALRLRERAAEGRQLCAQLNALRDTRESHGRALRGVLAALNGTAPEAVQGTELTALLSQAESRLRILEVRERNRSVQEEAVSELADSTRRLGLEGKAAEAELGAWRRNWAALMRELGLGEEASPGEVSDYLESVAEIATLADEAAELGRRIQGIDDEAGRFQQEATGLLARLAPDLTGQRVEDAVLQLHARLGSHKEARSRLEELRAQTNRAEDEAREAGATIQRADQVLAELCKQAGCGRPEELQAVEQRCLEHRRLVEELQDAENQLMDGGDGLGIDTLQSEAQAVDKDALLSELGAIARQLDEQLRPEREALFEGKVNAEREFAAMAGGDEASALAEEVQQTLSELRALGERYVRVKLAGRILRDEIEHFRRQHRDPILTRASDYFEKLTCGSFVAVDTDFDESDQPVLVGVRPGGTHLRVEGLSTGTRDQLYLALRLATLDHYLDGSEPLPFIVDDILIQFDDERARATLAALADFSARTQVILFTHHGRVAEQASRLQGAGQVFVHELA